MSRAALALVLALAACARPPRALRDGGAADLAVDLASGSEVTLLGIAAFGEEGETPTHLVPAGGGRLLALTDRAVHVLDGAGRLLRRTPLPVAGSGAVAVVESAVPDGTGLGLALRCGTDPTLAAGSYLALADAEGGFATSGLIPLGPPPAAPRGDFDGLAHVVGWTAPVGPAALALHLRRVVRGAPPPASETLLGDLPAEAELGALLAPAPEALLVCTLEPAGRARLRRFTGGPASRQALPPVELGAPDRPALGPCRLAATARTALAVTRQRALPPALVDAGGGKEIGLGALSFDVVLAQLVGRDDGALRATERLSLAPGTVRLENALWDGTRYVALLDAAGQRGGRLYLAALDEQGLIARDLLIPLAYEPGEIVAARLSLDSAGPGRYALLFAQRRPHDLGLLYLARLSVRWP